VSTERFRAVFDELDRAVEKFGPFASAHEGYAVILEELDELWYEVKHGTPARQRAEAIQVAAMSLRFLADLCGES
jgi:hypothetical protein